LYYHIDPVTLPANIGSESIDARIMISEGVIAAFGQIIKMPHSCLHFDRIIVSPEHRGKGLGGDHIRLKMSYPKFNAEFESVLIVDFSKK